MKKKVAIVQSNYIPWKGYFDIINQVDEFVLFDDVQYTRRDWRNRNKIKTPSGPQWLTIPVVNKGKFLQKINETTIDGRDWTEKHWKSIQRNYSKAPYFNVFADRFEAVYLECARHSHLSDVNHSLITFICRLLNINTRITWSMDYKVEGRKTERLISICKQIEGTEYLSGPAARTYLDEGAFRTAGIKLTFVDYAGYPEYPQLFPPFVHELSIVDLIFNAGTEAPKYMKSFVL